MSRSPSSARSAHPSAPVARQPAYGEQARSYNRKTGPFQQYRRAVVDALPVRRGQVVLDVGCGTGLCSGLLREKVGPEGGVVGIEESPEMAAVAREQIEREGWHNVTVVQSPAEDAEIEVTADGALFCAVHDILQSPDALKNVVTKLRPGAWVAAGGGKFAAPLLVGLNLQARVLHAPYVRNFQGFGRPWSHLERLTEAVRVRETGLGTAYIMTGQVPQAASAG